MKKLILLLFVFVFIINSCDDADTNPVFDFKNQTVQGTIEGVAWLFKEGLAENSQGGLSIQLSSTDYASPCDEFVINTQIRFFINEAGTGEFNMDTDGFANFIGFGFVTGGLEITSLSASSVSGKVDVEYTDDVSGVVSEINGNFTVPICN